MRIINKAALVGILCAVAITWTFPARATCLPPPTISGVITSLSSQDCYVQPAGALKGTLVQGSTCGLTVGDVVDVTGDPAVVRGEFALASAVITRTGSNASFRYVGIPGKWIGGGPTLTQTAPSDYVNSAWVPARGANNTGMPVRVWGTVTATYYSPATSAKWIYVDDGSGVVSDYGDRGILVYTARSVGVGSFVSVSGISSVEQSLDDPSRLIRVIVADDAVEGPLSAEFSGPELDRGWSTLILSPDALLSLTENPGFLTMHCSSTGFGPEVLQCVSGNWDAVTKIRCVLGEGSTASTTVYFSLKNLESDSPQQAKIAAIDWYPGSGAMVTIQPFPGTQQWGYVGIPSDTVYVRIRQRCSTLYVSASADGEVFGDEWATAAAYAYLPNPTSPFLSICTKYGEANAVLIDYIRFSTPND